MSKKQEQSGKKGPLVEDTERVGGRDKKTGADKIAPKTSEQTADESVEATDERENKKPKSSG